MKVRINRQEWLRGEGGDYSRLHRSSDDKKCCIGFLALAKGIPLSMLTDMSTLFSAAEVFLDRNEPLPERFAGLVTYDKYQMLGDLLPIQDAYTVNDDEHTTDAEKEEKIIALLKEIDIEVEFYG